MLLGSIILLIKAEYKTINLNVDPGEYSPEIDLLTKGDIGLFAKLSHSSWEMLFVNKLGSKLGDDSKASISPFLTSIATIEPILSFNKELAYFCNPISIVNFILLPLTLSSLLISLISLPSALTSKCFVPGKPLKSFS